MSATTAQVAIEEYLSTMYHPDCDYVDGELLERNVGEWDHSEVQANIASYFRNRRREWNVRVATELRIRVGPRRVRLPDVCVVLGDKPNEPVLTSPPFLCIEILSPSDNRKRVLARIADFLAFGVPYVWVIDTETRQAWVHTAGAEQEVLDGVLRAGHCEVPLAELFD